MIIIKSVSYTHLYKEKEYMIPACGHLPLDRRPVIAGAGPAGLFCAYILAEAGDVYKRQVSKPHSPAR